MVRCNSQACSTLLICLLLFCCCFLTSGTEKNQTSPLIPLIASNGSSNTNVYAYKEEGGNIDLPQSWVYVRVKVVDDDAHQKLLQHLVPNPGVVGTTFFLQKPVYVSLTTMASRLNNVSEAITSLVQARVVPTKIFLVISKNPHLLDEGVKVIPDDLLCLAAAGFVNIIFTFNTGPHRKLLPVLKRYWNKDVFIATVDDDMSQAQGYIILYQLLKTYVLNNQTNAVVALRARRIAFCTSVPYRMTKYSSWTITKNYNRQEMMVMPTGTGGVLYQPKQFHKIVFAKPFWYATGTADDLMFRLATMAKNVSVILGCSLLVEYGGVFRTCPEDEIDRKYDTMYGRNSTLYYTGLLAANAKSSTVQPLAQQTAHSNSANRSSKRKDSRSTLSASEPRLSCSSGMPCTAANTTINNKSSQSSHHRRLYSLKKALSHQKRTGTETELFSINKKGGNDLAWKLAGDILKSLIKFDMQEIVKNNLYEREDYCYSRNNTAEVEKHCAIYNCDKSAKI